MAAHAVVLLFAVLILGAAFFLLYGEIPRRHRAGGNGARGPSGPERDPVQSRGRRGELTPACRELRHTQRCWRIPRHKDESPAGFLTNSARSARTSFPVAGDDGVVIANTTRIAQQPEVADLSRSEPLFLSPVFQQVVKSGVATAGIEAVYPNSIAVVAIAPIRGEGPAPLRFRAHRATTSDTRSSAACARFAHTDLAIEYREIGYRRHG